MLTVYFDQQKSITIDVGNSEKDKFASFVVAYKNEFVALYGQNNLSNLKLRLAD